MVRGERAALLEPRVDGPVRLRGEPLDLPLSVDDEGEGGRLHAADGEEVLADLVRSHRDEAGEDRAPREVDDLAGLRGLREGKVHFREIPERVLDLPLRERRVPGPPGADARVDVLHDRERLDPDQLPLSVEVRGDDDLVLSGGDLAERLLHVRRGDDLHGLRPHEALQVDLLPGVQLLGVVEVLDVPPESDDRDVLASGGEREHRDLVGVRALHRSAGQDRGDPGGGVVLLRYNEFSHRVSRHTRAGLI